MKRALHILGTTVALACIGFLVVGQLPNLPALDWSAPLLWAAMALSLVFYVVSQLTASEAWRAILSLSGVNIAAELARSQLMIAQIGKYIPGNVAHLFGRIAIGRRDGVAGGALAASMVLEVGITLGVGLSVAGILVLALPQVIPNLTTEFPQLASRVVPVSIAAILAIAIGIGGILLRARLRALDAPSPSFSALTKPLGWHLISFAAHGVSLWAATFAIAPDAVPSVINCTLIFAFAWAAGFMMPGAPAGIGVRDSIIVLGLALTVGDGSAVAIALLHRAVSVAGDVSTFGIGWTMRRIHANPLPRNGPEPAAISAD
jgi:hypothetical protein